MEIYRSTIVIPSWFLVLLLAKNLIICESGQPAYSYSSIADSFKRKHCHDQSNGLMKPDFKSMQKVTECFREFATHGKLPKFEDHGFRADQTIQNHGYYLKIYNNITSSDGYIQTMFRVTGSPKSPPRPGKPSMLLLHGIPSSSDSWLLIGNKSFPFVLADAGYEVWLANYRGTDYSDRHVKLDSNKDFKYWDFSYHEIAVYDIPLYANLILSETGAKKLFALGHSAGTKILITALSEN